MENHSDQKHGRMGIVTSADGTKIVFYQTGTGPPLVLVHGNGDVHKFWELGGACSTLADYCTVYAIERRGRGKSGDASGYGLEREAEDIAAIVDAIGEPVILLGHSGGALYALEASLRTDNLRKLILNQPPIAAGSHDLDFIDEVVVEMRRLLADGENEQVLVFFLRDIAELTPDELDNARSSSIWPDMVKAAPVLPRELQAVGDYEFDAARFAAMTTPTLLLTGSETHPLYKDATEAVNDVLPNSRIVTFDGHAHEPMNTAPDRFVNEVLAFIRESS